MAIDLGRPCVFESYSKACANEFSSLVPGKKEKEESYLNWLFVERISPASFAGLLAFLFVALFLLLLWSFSAFVFTGALLSVFGLTYSFFRMRRSLRYECAEHSGIFAIAQQRIRDLEAENKSLHDREERSLPVDDGQGRMLLCRNVFGQIIFVNDMACRFFGSNRSRLVGSFYHPKLLNPEREFCGTTAGRIVPRPGVYDQNLVLSVGERWVSWLDFPFYDASGELIEIRSVGYDVREKIRAPDVLPVDGRNREGPHVTGCLFALSEEVRTALNNILSKTGFLLDTPLTSEQRSCASMVKRSSESLLSFMNESFDFLKLDSGAVEFYPVVFDLGDLVQTVIELLAPQAEERGLDLGSMIDPDVPRLLFGDESCLRRILLDFAAHRLASCECGGLAIDVSLAEEHWDPSTRQLRLCFSVRDTGFGIASDFLENTRKNFDFSDFLLEGGQNHSDLRLVISHLLVELMGGLVHLERFPLKGNVISFELSFAHAGAPVVSVDMVLRGYRVALLSNSVMEGPRLANIVCDAGGSVKQFDDVGLSLFWLVEGIDQGEQPVILSDLSYADSVSGLLSSCSFFPVKKRIALLRLNERNQVSRMGDLGFDSYIVRPVRPASLFSHILDHGEEKIACTPVPCLLPTKKKQSGLRVLLAEDNEVCARLAGMLMRQQGHDVVHVYGGEAALRHLRDQDEKGSPFDVVMMDVHMPEMDGPETVRQIRALSSGTGGQGTGSIPVIAMLGYACDADRIACLHAGMDDFLSKPFVSDELATVLKRWSGRRSSTRGARIL